MTPQSLSDFKRMTTIEQIEFVDIETKNHFAMEGVVSYRDYNFLIHYKRNEDGELIFVEANNINPDGIYFLLKVLWSKKNNRVALG